LPTACLWVLNSWIWRRIGVDSLQCIEQP
jgi:hypothetical protein